MSKKYKQPKSRRGPLPGVTRWTPLVLKTINAHKDELRALGVSPSVMAATLLCVIHHESVGGNPEARSGTNDVGLTQLKLKGPNGEIYNTEEDAYNPVRNLQIAMRVTLKMLKRHDGDLAAAMFARGWGDGNFKKWMKGGGKDHWGKYFHRLFLEYFPRYSAWLKGWIEAGQPQDPGTVRSKGEDYDLSLATHEHGFKGAPFPAPYTGVYKAHGHTRTYKKVKTSKGSAPKLPASITQISGGDMATAGLTLASGGTALALAVSPEARQLAKTGWEALKGLF